MFKKRGTVQNYTGFFGRHKSAIATATLIGTIIGAGILGIPYVVAQVGIIYGLLMVVGLGLAFLCINLFVGEIVLRTKGKHQMTGYAEKYLGKWGKHLMGLVLIIGIHGSLIAYTLGEGSTLSMIFKIGSPLLYSIIFYLIGMFIVMRGLKATGKAELILISALFVIIVLMGIFSYDKMSLINLQTHDLSKLFLPYGVILFAYMGFACIPEVSEELGTEKKKLRGVIIAGSVIPMIIYVLFTFVVVGIVGVGNFNWLQPDQRIATLALSLYSGPVLGTLANILALLTMFTSFLALSTILLDIYIKDYRVHSGLAHSLIAVVPLILVLTTNSNFIKILGTVGVFIGGSEGIIMILTYLKARKNGDRKPEYSFSKPLILAILLLAMFVFGIVLHII